MLFGLIGPAMRLSIPEPTQPWRTSPPAVGFDTSVASHSITGSGLVSCLRQRLRMRDDFERRFLVDSVGCKRGHTGSLWVG